MEIRRFKEIIRYGNEHKERAEAKLRDFYTFVGMNSEGELLNLMQIARALFQRKRYIIVEMPFADQEIGAICYQGASIGYTFLNTSLPKVNVNFALAHEVYHVFCQETEFCKKVELYINEHYYEHDEEFMANLFAGMLLMPEQSYCRMYHKFRAETREEDSPLSVLVKLMNYYEVPYMAVLIRCYELNLLEGGAQLEELLKVDANVIRREFSRLWLDENMLNATKQDDFRRLESFVEMYGIQYIEDEYLNARTLKKALQNMRKSYEKIKGE